MAGVCVFEMVPDCNAIIHPAKQQAGALCSISKGFLLQGRGPTTLLEVRLEETELLPGSAGREAAWLP